VADVAAALDGEEKPGGCLFSPCVEPLGRRLPVERVIQLNSVEVPRVEGELLACRQSLGVEAAAPVGIRPACTSDPDLARHGQTLRPRSYATSNSSGALAEG